ncbi:hypothetical protein G7Y89_g3771 [Cudoniella acicularis]|uniref:Uncharacterized protein n=1 Tax=Cudoniella acicularis TaxID=354080 RepID=A0A8H4RRZ1_9HELO|nr:hypothetical protein G7Y89_g3771 [Cudoniella acicularis]
MVYHDKSGGGYPPPPRDNQDPQYPPPRDEREAQYPPPPPRDEREPQYPPRDERESQYPPPPGEEDDRARAYHHRGPSTGSITLPSISPYDNQYAQPSNGYGPGTSTQPPNGYGPGPSTQAPNGYGPGPANYQHDPFRTPSGGYRDDRGYQQDYGRGGAQHMAFSQFGALALSRTLKVVARIVVDFNKSASSHLSRPKHKLLFPRIPFSLACVIWPLDQMVNLVRYIPRGLNSSERMVNHLAQFHHKEALHPINNMDEQAPQPTTGTDEEAPPILLLMKPMVNRARPVAIKDTVNHNRDLHMSTLRHLLRALTAPSTVLHNLRIQILGNGSLADNSESINRFATFLSWPVALECFHFSASERFYPGIFTHQILRALDCHQGSLTSLFTCLSIAEPLEMNLLTQFTRLRKAGLSLASPITIIIEQQNVTQQEHPGNCTSEVVSWDILPPSIEEIQLEPPPVRYHDPENDSCTCCYIPLRDSPGKGPRTEMSQLTEWLNGIPNHKQSHFPELRKITSWQKWDDEIHLSSQRSLGSGELMVGAPMVLGDLSRFHGADIRLEERIGRNHHFSNNI